jgi:hypothetical protein
MSDTPQMIKLSPTQLSLLKMLYQQINQLERDLTHQREKLQIAMTLVCDAHGVPSTLGKMTLDDVGGNLVIE